MHALAHSAVKIGRGKPSPPRAAQVVKFLVLLALPLVAFAASFHIYMRRMDLDSGSGSQLDEDWEADCRDYLDGFQGSPIPGLEVLLGMALGSHDAAEVRQWRRIIAVKSKATL